MTRPIPRLFACAAGSILAALVFSCETLPTGPADAGGMRVKGITLADWTAGGYGGEAAATALDEIRDVGAGTVVLIRTAYQADPGADAVAVDARTPSVASLESAAARAHDLGLDVVIKPHVDLDDGRWRGTIAPRDARAWFASYGEFVLECARLCERVGAAQLVVGTELAGTIEHDALWRRLIGTVRDAYGGEIAYAASWDNAHRVGFWDALDVVGVDFYGSVTRRDDPGRVEILAGWQPWIDRLHRLHRLTGKRLILAEIGYRSVDGAGQTPYQFTTTAPIDTEEQADLYWAALEALAGHEWIAGVYWWNWLVGGQGGPGDDDYTPRNKPAAIELREGWR